MLVQQKQLQLLQQCLWPRVSCVLLTKAQEPRLRAAAMYSDASLHHHDIDEAKSAQLWQD